MNIREVYGLCGHRKAENANAREKRQQRCPDCRYDRGMEILAKATLLGVLAMLVIAAVVAWAAQAFGAEPLSTAIGRLPVYFEDRAEKEQKAAQLADMATAIEQACAQHAAPMKEKDCQALAGAVSWHESTNSLRIHRGDCKPHECDGGRARGPWQQHRNGRSQQDWDALIGIENTGYQAEAAVKQLRRGFLTCRGAKVPWLAGTLNNYAGKACDAPEWPGRADREETWTKIRRRLVMGLRYLGGVVNNVRDRPTPVYDAAARVKDSAGLTPGLRRVLVAIAELRVELNACPTYRQVADRANVLSTNDVSHRISRLVGLGYVARGDWGGSRTLHPTDLGWRISGVDSGGLADPRVERAHRCHRCAAVTFKPHQPATCRQLLTGQTFAEQQP